MREITSHPVNDTIKITVLDEPGAGGANHHYMVTLPDWTRAPDGSNAKGVWDIQFQNGPIAENGVNGVTQEVLLAIVADRLRSFQAGPYACNENMRALVAVEDAQRILAELKLNVLSPWRFGLQPDIRYWRWIPRHWSTGLQEAYWWLCFRMDRRVIGFTEET